MKNNNLDFVFNSKVCKSNQLNFNSHVLKYNNDESIKPEDAKKNQMPGNGYLPPNQNPYPVNPSGFNGQYPPPPGNYYGPYPYPGYPPYAPMPDYNDSNFKRELKNARKVSIASIVIFFILVFFTIFTIVFAFIYAASAVSYYETSFSETSNNSDAIFTWYIVFVVFLALFWIIGNLVCGIVGAVRCSGLKRKDHQYASLMTLYIIGIFIPLCQLVAAFMILSRTKYLVDKK